MSQNRFAFMLKFLISVPIIFGITAFEFRWGNDNLPPNDIEIQNIWVDSVFNTMTPDERIGQLFMVEVYSKLPDTSPNFKKVETCIDSCHIGGVIFFQGGPVRQANLLNKLQSKSKIPLMVAQDAEWGLSMRLDSVPIFPKNLMLGAIEDDNLVYDVGLEIGRECRRLGVNIDCMPCVDLYDNLENSVIVNRSFGSNKFNVAKKGNAISKGMQQNGILTTAKHFPGHGNTKVDSHQALPIISDTYMRIDTMELYPFKYLIQRGIGGVMVGHLLVPSIVGDNDKTPASISKKVIKNLLIDSLQFDGLVFTDALQMKGVSKNFKNNEIALYAFEAGVDVFLMPGDCMAAYKTIVNARNSGRISQAEIDKRCKKILLAKYKMGLDKYRPVETKNLIEDLNSQYAKELERKIVENAVTLIKNDDNLLPLWDFADKRIAVVSIGTETGFTDFENTFQAFYNVDKFTISKNAKMLQFNQLQSQLNDYDLVILGLHGLHSYPQTFGFNDDLITFIDNISASKKVFLNLFTSPVALNKLRNINNIAAIAVSYDDSDMSRSISATMALGMLPYKGKLSVGISQQFPEEKSIKTKTKIKK